MTRPRQESFPTSAQVFRADYVRDETHDEQAALLRPRISPEPALCSRVVVGGCPQTDRRLASGQAETQYKIPGSAWPLHPGGFSARRRAQSLRIRPTFIGFLVASAPRTMTDCFSR